ncbi:MAG: aminoglycoside phosphotransferase family protein [Acidobacteriota bacterium]|nr:aminoglycoside phosphotransferase family protein [Acidobacteriota bacterium]MDE3265860.1 aminoglycoside phosphotransferase family protein [Acidobacteriota bacterium]
MEEELFLRRIREEFPDVTWTSHRYLTHGWDHAVLVLDEALVFRAPRTQAYRDALANEVRLLRYLRPRVDAGIPDYVYESADGSFAGYPLLAGRELDVATFGCLSDTERERIAEQLATFLTAIHETPKSVVRECGVSRQDPRKDHEDLRRDTEALVLPRLAPREVRIVGAFLAELAGELQSTPPTCLVHGDLSGEHILWDAESRQVNVIDFSDRSIGDPALDFDGPMAYGHNFAERVLELYRGRKDDGLLRRAHLYFRRGPLETMVDALQGYPCTFDEGYAAFRARFDL